MRRAVICRRHILWGVLLVSIGCTLYIQFELALPANVRTHLLNVNQVVESSGTHRTSTIKTFESNRSLEVPKIIHRMFKTDLRGGPWPNPSWEAADQSWQRFFPEPEFTHFFWTDDEIADYFKEHCADHFKLFTSYIRAIERVDIARYCILWGIGGIYADLDYEVRRNFFHEFPKELVSLVQSPYKNEVYQNSLMASPAKHQFWKLLLDAAEREFQRCYFKMEFARQKFYQEENEKKKLGTVTKEPAILKVPGCPTSMTAFTGPELLEEVDIPEKEPMVYMLPCQLFQRATHSDHEDEYKRCGLLNESVVPLVNGIHWGTWTWSATVMGTGEATNEEIWDLFYKLHPELWSPAREIPKIMHKLLIKLRAIFFFVFAFLSTLGCGLYVASKLQPELFAKDVDD